MKPAKLHVRLATEADYQNILKVSEDIYKGIDYLPKNFHKWLQIPNKLFYLAELDGIVIGTIVVNILSGGKTFYMQALRLRKDYRERGLSRVIDTEITNAARRLYPEVTKKHVTLFQGYSAANAFSLVRRDYKKVEEQPLFICHIKRAADFTENLSKISQRFSRITSCELHPYHVEDAETIFAGLGTIAPKKFICVGSDPYEALHSNIPYIFQKADSMFAEVSKEELKAGATMKSFSHGAVSHRVDIDLWVCSIYANDQELFRAHLLKQLLSAYENITDKDFIFCPNVVSKNPSFVVCEAKCVLEEEIKYQEPFALIKESIFQVFEKKFNKSNL